MSRLEIARLHNRSQLVVRTVTKVQGRARSAQVLHSASSGTRRPNHVNGWAMTFLDLLFDFKLSQKLP